MQCRAVREVADSFLADELDLETSNEVLRHLELCSACRADLDGRSSLRDGVRRAFENAPGLQPRPEFLADLRATLQPLASVPRQRAASTRPLWALAATVFLATILGGGYVGRDWLTARALARAAVGDHRDCALAFRLAEHSIPLEEAARKYDVAYRVLETEPPGDVTTTLGPARVLARHACVYKGRRFAHVVLQYRGARVSLLMTAVGGAGDRDLGSPVPVNVSTRRVSANQVDGLSLMSFRAGGYMVFVTGDVPQADLIPLAETIVPPIARELHAAIAR